MQFSKAMIDLIKEVRRRAPSDIKPSIKLANPNILHVLLELTNNSQDSVSKALIKEVLTLAGAPWPELLEQAQNHSQLRYHSKVYRGQSQLVEVKPIRASEIKAKPKRIYRGQVVN